MNIEKKVQSLQANSGLYAVRSCQDRPVIVGWSTAPRGQVIEECLGQLPKKLAAARACWQGLNHHTPIRDETGWTTRRSLGEVGTNSAHSKPVCLCGDCTFLDEIHRAGLEKKESLRTCGAQCVGWTTLVAGEMVASTRGLGFMVLNASEFLASDVVIMGIIVIGIFAYAFDVLMRNLERIFIPWKGKA
jgi:hypothetical protein